MNYQATDEKEDWTTEELLDAVKAYVGMSRDELSKTPFNKKEIYRDLAARHPKRSEKSFEYRMQNISYVMTLLGRPWVTGLKPAKNVGLRVAREIERLLALVEERAVDPKVEFEFTVNKAREHQPQTPPQGNRRPASRPSQTTQLERDPKVVAWVLENAKGVCECCDKPAPFSSVNGPFLEVHHVWSLAQGGPDTTDNAVALCPNCHRELHLGLEGKTKAEALYGKVPRLIRAASVAGG